MIRHRSMLKRKRCLRLVILEAFQMLQRVVTEQKGSVTIPISRCNNEVGIMKKIGEDLSRDRQERVGLNEGEQIRKGLGKRAKEILARELRLYARRHQCITHFL